MLSESEIIKKKINLRKCRNIIKNVENVQKIADDCSTILNIKSPKIICCDSLERSFSEFRLCGHDYIIYDSSLLESLYLYNNILEHNRKIDDINKFFSKLFAEEFIKNNNYKFAYYFLGKFIESNFSFKNISKNAADRVNYQNYFLICHELSHIMVRNSETKIPKNYAEYICGAVGALAKREIEERNITIEDYFLERNDYFSLTTIPHSINEYIYLLNKSSKFYHFIEECYCDYSGYKLLIENYNSTRTVIQAIIGSLNFLIIQEAIRNDIGSYGDDLKDILRDVSITFYYSFLRTQILLLTLQANELTDIKYALDDFNDNNRLIKELMDYINNLPDNDILLEYDTSKFPKMDNGTRDKALMNIPRS